MADDSHDGDIGDEGFDSPLDEVFVEGALYKEPSAAERAAWARAAREASKRKRRRRRGESRKARLHKIRARLPRVTPVLVFAGIAILAYLVWPGGGGGGGPDIEIVAPEQVRVVYALPSDGEVDETLVSAIRNEVGLAETWFREQADGHAPKFVMDGEELVVERRTLGDDTAELLGRRDAIGFVADEFRDGDGLLPPDEVLVVFVPLAVESTCGESGLTIVVVWVGACGDVPSTESTALDGGVSGTIAHELTHAMGAVGSCAPHYGRNGHVTDDPRDIVYDQPQGGPPPEMNDLVLDPGHDDYFDHGRADCPDIKNHPLWD